MPTSETTKGARRANPATGQAGAPAGEVLAMHGWAGQSSHWIPWSEALAPRGWRLRFGDRAYGGGVPLCPQWSGDCPGRRVVIGHSLGPHLIPAEVLASADAVVLLASFGRFVPPGRPGRRLETALAGMELQLAGGPTECEADERARTTLRRFLAEAAAPEPADSLPPGPGDGPLGAVARARLLEDLNLLSRTTGLPEGFPQEAPVLIVEAGEDRIVDPASRALLRQALPRATVIRLPGAGHALLRTPVIEVVQSWLRECAPP